MAVFTTVNLIQAVFTPISVDEAYYKVWSLYPDWGYFDHPPMVAWWNVVGNFLFDGTLGSRLLTVFLNGFSLFFLWVILKPETLKQFWLFVVLSMGTIVIQVFGFITTPDAPLLFFGLFYLLVFKRFLEKNSMNNAILLSLAMAGLAYSKYHGLLLIVFTVLPQLRKWIRNPKFYLAVIISLMLYLPHLLWIVQHDFIPLRYHFSDRSSDKSFRIDRYLTYPLMYFLGLSPLLAYFTIKALFRFKSRNDFQKSLKWLAILPGIFFLFSLHKESVQPQWLLISFLAMLMISYLYYADAPKLKWLFRLGWLSIGLILLIRIGLMLPGLSPFSINQNFAEELNRRNIDNLLFEKYQEASVFLFYNPDKKASVHRTLGNRKNQFSLWNIEDDFYGKSVHYVSPWVRGADSLKAYKDMVYYIKEIPDYLTFHQLKIETESSIRATAAEPIVINLKLYNGHGHPLRIGGDSDLQLNVSYYQQKQHEVVYKTLLETEPLFLKPGESRVLSVSFRNIAETGDYKASIGIQYSQIGTTYLSEVMEVISE
ncbi:MAG: glycosyltransferase family 39 protein [Weeksellaceae bacterium]|nr:glycosyltransferase family 39 protein [Weeksellaceae bacterium]